MLVIDPHLMALGPMLIPPHTEIELRGPLGPQVSFNLRVVPSRPEDYRGPTPRLTLVRAFLYPPSDPDADGCVVWGGGAPSCEDFEHRPRGLGVPREGGVALMRPQMPKGSAIGVIVRNNTCDPVEASISVASTSLGDGERDDKRMGTVS